MKGWVGLVVAAMVLIQFSVQAQQNGQIIATGDGFSFMVGVPAGWQSSASDAQGQSLKMVMVPEGQEWGTAESVIYSNVTTLSEHKRETIYDIVNFDLEMYRISDATLQVEDGEGIAVDKGKNTALVVKVISPANGTWEAIAYIPENGKVPFVVLSSETEEGFIANYPVFEKVVSSFKYYENVNVVRSK